ncbi:MAG: arylsulfatase [Verrucomicrobiota bacterium]
MKVNEMKQRAWLWAGVLGVILVGATGAAERPNIVFILADDMGVGDVSHTTGLAPTPHIDRLAAEGMRFTDAHTTSSVCTPTRYGVLTGRYNWRTRLKKGVFFSPHDAPLIETGETTVASLLQEQGYETGCVGKWHLGIGWQFKEDADVGSREGYDVDYLKPAVTPRANGFDYFFGIQASLDMAPYVYIENDQAIEDATVTKGFNRKGAAAPDFDAVNCLRDFAEQSVAFIDRCMEEPEKPFFLYLPLTSPHTPIVPGPEWEGKSELGSYGDFLMETDWVVGEVLGALDEHGVTGETLVVFSTDNGCSPAAKIDDLVAKGHKPNGELRGHKADIYEGGHRVPFIVRWPGVVEAGSETDRLTCQTDFLATCAEIVGRELKAEEGVDSVSFLGTLKDGSQTARDAIVHHSIGGYFAIREGKWKLCFCPGSGGWSAPRPGKEPEGSPPVQ